MELIDIFPIRLKSARKIAGLSMDGLVEKIQNIVSKAAIGKYEQGKMLPDSKILIALANGLNVSIDYFFRPLNYKLTNIEFRKKSKLLQNKQEQIKEKAIDYLERYIVFERKLRKIGSTGLSGLSDDLLTA